MMKQENSLKKLKEHQPIIVDYGKGLLSNDHVLEKAIWNNEKNAYISETGIWNIKLLIEIATGKVEGMALYEV